MSSGRYKRRGAPVKAQTAPAASAVATRADGVAHKRSPGRHLGKLRAARSVGPSAMMHAMSEIAVPYEIGSEVARMPTVGNAGPVALAGAHANIRKVARHMMRTDGIIAVRLRQAG